MSFQLGLLYHWSPRDRLKSITRLGLVPGRRNHHGPVFHGIDDDGNKIRDERGSDEFRQAGICFSLDPVTAWSYSHDAWKSVGTFDLWAVELAPSDEVHIVPNWGGRIVEVRVHNRVPKSRVRWVGERSVLQTLRGVPQT